MIHALIQGELIADPVERQSAAGKPFTTATVRAATGEADAVLVGVVAFGQVAEKLARLKRGDALAATGALRPTQWTGRDGAERHGLSLTAAAVLTVYEAGKRRKAVQAAGDAPDAGDDGQQAGTGRAASGGSRPLSGGIPAERGAPSDGIPAGDDGFPDDAL